MADMLAEALTYARRGWYVFPCREKPGEPYVKNGETIIPTEKQPYVARGLNDASIDEDQIVAWWTKWKNAMIGVNAGKSGLFVIDIDKKHANGLDTFAEWDINDSAGLHSITPSGGMHIIFTGVGKSSANAITGIDTRGDGGYFIAPPSKIIEGEYSGDYKMFGDWNKTPGVIPDGLMAKLFPNQTTEYVRGNVVADGGEKKQLSRATLNFLANGAPAGERNSTLFKVLADFAGCGYTQAQAKDIVFPVCTRIGLGASEFEQVISHAYGKPRTPSIPDSLQEKILSGKNAASQITSEEQTIMEEAVLACMLTDSNIIPSVNDILNFEDFRVLKNRLIYKSINRLFLSGMKVDYLTTHDELVRETDKISLEDLLTMINRYYINPDNVTSYAYIIREKASIRKIEALMDNKDQYLVLGNFDTIVNSIEKDIASIALYGGTKSASVLTSEQAVEMVEEQTRLIREGKIEQLKIGFSDYDYHIGGLYSSELVICAGRPGDGKSALVMSIVNHIGIVEKKPVAFFSLEMSTHESICRLICQLTGLGFRDVYQGRLTDKEWVLYKEAMDKISASKIFFDDGFAMTVPEIRSKIRKLTEEGIKLVVIDQLEQIKGYEGLPTYIQYDKICYDIKNFTKEFNVPIILNHQLNRGITDRKLKNPEPQLSDLNQAGEKAANQVWVISHNKDEQGNILRSRIKILKNRNGPRMDIPVVYIGERMLFSNPTKEEQKVFYDAGQEDEYSGEPAWSQ